MIFRDIDRQIHPQRVINKVVFDLDRLLKQELDVADNTLLTVAKEQLKLGHARKGSNSRYIRGIQIIYMMNSHVVYLYSVINTCVSLPQFV